MNGEEWDAEAKAMNTACLYFEGADERARERFIYHLVHRYFPVGEFKPKRTTFEEEFRER